MFNGLALPEVLSVDALLSIFCNVLVRWPLWLFWIFLALISAEKKNTNVPPNALAI
jgi:hypothetical protein